MKNCSFSGAVGYLQNTHNDTPQMWGVFVSFSQICDDSFYFMPLTAKGPHVKQYLKCINNNDNTVLL